MPVPSVITDLSTTLASNSPAGSDNVFPDLDNYLRAHAQFVALLRDGRGLSTEVSLASAATCDIGGAASMFVQITGTTTITSFGTNYLPRVLRFAGVLTLTHNATTLILPTGANITTAAGDMCLAVPVGTSGWRVLQYQRASEGADFVSFLQSGTGAQIRTVQSKLRDVVSASDFGAVADFATDNTASVQSAINSLGTYGGTVFIKDGCRFNLLSLTLPARCNIEYRVDDDISAPGPLSDIASSERVLFSSNSSYPASPTGGIVNEWRFTAPFHPGAVVDVRKDVTSAATYLGPGQSMTNPVRASYNILDEQTQRWITLYVNYDTWSNFSGTYLNNFRIVVTLNGIGTAQWTSVPAATTLITGQTSGAKGFLLSVAAGATTVLWFSGKFVAGERLIDNNETTTATVTSVSTTSTSMPWLAQDFRRGNWSVGLPPGVPTHSFAVGGKIAATKSRTSGQYIDDTITNPAYVLVDDYEAGTPAGFEITYNVAPAAASRRLTLRNLGSTADRAHIGAVHAHCSFTDAGAISTSAYNIASFTKNATGDYTLTFTNAAARADFSTVVATQDPLQYAYVFAYGTGSVRIRVVTTGTSTLVNATGSIHMQCMGGDI